MYSHPKKKARAYNIVSKAIAGEVVKSRSLHLKNFVVAGR